MTEPNERSVALNVLRDVNKNIKILIKDRPQNIFGECDNRLLTQFD